MRRAEIVSIPLFARLSPVEQEQVAEVARARRFSVGHVIVNEGEFAFDFYAIKQGAAEVRRGGEQVATLTAGDFFGEIGVVRDESHRWSRRRQASVVATVPVEAIVIDGRHFRQLIEEMPTLRAAVRSIAAQRRRD